MSQKPISQKKYGLPIGSCIQPLLLAGIAIVSVLCPRASLAQVVGIDDTAVNRSGNQFEISGGSTIGPNQFFSFDRFSLDSSQTAIFLNRGGVDNVLAKVSGGLPSNISGQIQFLNNNPHFYLINPAGIVFGPTAQLNLKMAFTATTASAIGFGGDVWWDVKSGWSQPNVMDLSSPTALRFSPGTPGAIVNLGSINAYDNLSLIGGTVLNAGNLIVPGGRIHLATVAGNTVQLLSPSGLLRVELPSQAIPPLGFTPVSLPELITGAAPANANGIVINPDGTVVLTVNRDDAAPRNVTVKPGDIYTTTIGDRRVTAGLPEQVMLQSQGHLYGDHIHAYGGEEIAKIIGTAEQGIDLGHLSLQAARDANQLYLANRLGTVSLQSSAGNVFVSTIDNPVGRIQINAKGLFQSTGFLPNGRSSLLAYNRVSIRYADNQSRSSDSIDTADVGDAIDIRGTNNRPFLVGPAAVNGIDIPTWLSRGVSGTVGGIELKRIPGTPPGMFPPSNNPSLVFQDQRFGVLPSDSGNQQPPANQPPGNQPPGNQPPSNQPPANQPPANQPPANRPPDDASNRNPSSSPNDPNNSQRSTASDSRWDKSTAIVNYCQNSGTNTSTGCAAISDPATEDAEIIQLLMP